MGLSSMSFLLGVAITPLAWSSAFLPALGPLKACWDGSRIETVRRSSTLTGDYFASSPRARMGVSMAIGNAGSRAEFVERLTAGVAATATGILVGGLGVGVAPAVADSTGKYSSKATAKKRYLPRIAKMVTSFQLLKKNIADGSATPKSAFFVDVLPDSVSAMDLYGSSMKRGEYPDKKSKGLQQLAQDFGSACESVGKTLGKKNRDVATTMKAYDKAAELLTSYLKGTELDPLGSESYN